MNYEFHVGDYVKTRAGYVGYIESLHSVLFGDIGLWVRFTDGDSHCFEVTDKNIANNFLRIGAYDFTKKEKKKIELLNYTATVKDLIDKTNELVDAVNELMGKEDK